MLPYNETIVCSLPSIGLIEESHFSPISSGHKIDNDYYYLGLLKKFYKDDKSHGIPGDLAPSIDLQSSTGSFIKPRELLRSSSNQTEPKSETFLVRVFTQGYGNEQSLPLSNAIRMYIEQCNTANKVIVFEWMSNAQMRDRKWTEPSFLVNWLLLSHLHVIVSQGLHMGTFNSPGLNWQISDIYEQLKR